MSTRYFDGIQYKAERKLAEEEILTVVEDNGKLMILVKNKGDHPTLISINLVKKTFDIEGYD